MPLIASFLVKLRVAHPEYSFVSGDHFRWSPDSQEIIYDASAQDSEAHILHELAHALLGHSDYDKDIQLIAIERDAWQYAKAVLCSDYDVTITDNVIEDSLDTYRDWLHARSTCPSCRATGLQHKKYHYRCVACHHQWRVNDARICGLRRHSLVQK